jgi:O-antigen ligase
VRRLSFYLLLVFVFSVPWQNAIQIGGSKTLTSIIGIAAVGVALMKCLLDGKVAKPPFFLVAFGVLIWWQLMTYFWSGDPTSTLVRAATMVQMLAMVWLIAESCASERERLQLIQAFVFGCLVASGALIYAYFADESVAGYRYTPAGFDPNELACVIAAGIPMALLVATSAKRGVLRWIDVLYVPFSLFVVILTASRTGFVATCIGLCSVPFALYFLKPLPRLAWSFAIMAMFVGAFYLMPSSLNENIQRVTFLADTQSISTLTTRTTIWSAGLEAFQEHPAIGVGFGTYGAIAQAKMGVAKASHNLWIQTAAETGGVGLALLLAVLAAAIIPALRPRGRPMIFHIILFGVLMTTSLSLDVVANKSLWMGLAFLAVAGSHRGMRDHACTELVPQVEVCPVQAD